MDEITAKVSELELSYPDIHVYAKAFDDIVSYIRQIRKEALSCAEISVTKSFAGPFTSGGLLVVLLEPLHDHRWREGAHVVISDCPSLSALDEGLQVTSNGTLSIMHCASLLDLRPFICQLQNSRLADREREKLYDLVIKAIEAKKPDVILCMGKVRVAVSYVLMVTSAYSTKEPKNTLLERQAQFSDEFRKHAEWVYAMHPSHSVNYNSDDIELRTQLLNSIAEACHKLNVKNPGLLPALTGCGNPNGRLRLIPSREDRRDTRWVEILLQTLIVLCLRPRHRLPAASLNTNHFYKLARWHEDYFVHILDSPDVKDDQATKIATSLIPLFRRLNKSMKTTSWYLQTYEANWGEIADVLTDGHAILEDVRGLLDNNNFYGTCGNGAKAEPTDTDGSSDILSRGKCIAHRMAALVHDGSPRPERNTRWISIAH